MECDRARCVPGGARWVAAVIFIGAVVGMADNNGRQLLLPADGLEWGVPTRGQHRPQNEEGRDCTLLLVVVPVTLFNAGLSRMSCGGSVLYGELMKG